MPKVKSSILVWARETAQYSLEEAARRLGLVDSIALSAVQKLQALEAGESDPSRSLLLRMSKQYRRPLLTFYLEDRPRTGDRGEDFRMLPSQMSSVANAYVDTLIRETRARQITVREALIDADEGESLEFVGRLSIDNGIKPIVNEIKELLRLDIQSYRDLKDPKEAFKFLRDQAENAGIFVILKGNLGSHHTEIDVEAFRGFAISDDIAPFIVINDRDAESAWSFTLLHELAHVAIGATGISGGYAETKIEKFCNEVASEILLPENEFVEFDISDLGQADIRKKISQYALSLNVSSAHISYRLYRRGDIELEAWRELRDFYKNMWLDERKRKKEKARQNEGGPNYYVVKNYKMGGLVGLVKRLTYSGALTTTKAGMLLDVRPLKVHKLFDLGQPV